MKIGGLDLKEIRGERGAAAVEFAILALLLIIIVFGIIEFGFIWLQSHYIANAAREGARVAAKISPGEVDYKIKARGAAEGAVKEYLKGLYNEDRVEGTAPYPSDFLNVTISDPTDGEKIDVPELPDEDDPPAIKVTVTVKTAQVWDPILWDLLDLLPGSSGQTDLSEITEFSIFAVEP